MTTPGPSRTSRRPRAGDIVDNRFLLTSMLGEGFSGIVYAAVDQPAGKDVAIKFIHRDLLTDRQVRTRFYREAAILRRMQGRNVVSLLSFGAHDDLLYMALERSRGESLETLLASNEPLDTGRSADIAMQITSALAQAHAANVIHRDLKPANIMIDRADDGHDHVLVLDFGMAKVLQGDGFGSALTEQNMVFGTPQYMSPEQAKGDDLDGRCDIYAVGVILYELLTGSVPFGGKPPMATMTAHLTERPIPPRVRAPDRGISPALEAVVMCALEKNPADRYPSAPALHEALQNAVLNPSDTASVRPTAPQTTGDQLRRPPGAPANGDPTSGYVMPPIAWIALVLLTSTVGIAIGVWIASSI
jgi:eukaryotic-like serine/threonine-protein kinase